MEHWGFWDWVTYGTIGIAAGLLALETGLVSAPNVMGRLPRVFKHPYWGFVPFILVIFASGVLSARALGIIGSEPASQTQNARTSKPDASKVFLQSWGLYPPATFQVIVDGSQVFNYKDKFRLILIVRTSFSDVDRLSDERIEKSKFYTIENGLMALAHPSENKLKFLVQAATAIEYDVALIPEQVSANEITTLSSVEHVGGKIVGGAMQLAPPQQKPREQSKICQMFSC